MSYIDMGEKLLKKYGVSMSENSSSGKSSESVSGQQKPKWLQMGESLLEKYSQANNEERKKKVSDWVDQYNKVIKGWSDYSTQRNGGYTTDASGGFSGDIMSLIDDFNSIRDFADRMGLPNAQRYLHTLQDLQKDIAETDRLMAYFGSEDAYNKFVAEQEDYERKRTADVSELEKEIAQLEQQREDTKGSTSMYQSIYDSPVSRLKRKFGSDDRWEDIRQKGTKELTSQISQKKQFLNEAVLIQEQEQLVQWEQKYQGKSYEELQNALSAMNPSDKEYQWLSEYAQSAMRPEDYTERILRNTAELKYLEEALEEIRGVSDQINLGGEDPATVRKYKELSQKYGSASELEDRIEELNAENWKYQKAMEYGFLDENEDYGELSSKVSDQKTAGLGIGWGTNWWGQGDPVYDYINNIDGDREMHPAREGKTPYSVYDYMTEKEIADYNYLYNAQGQDAAQGYLEYLEYTLDQRQMQQLRENTAAYAEEHPVISSALSVPTNLVSGMGALDVAGQNAARKISGEYKPINYNSGGMVPTAVTTATREAVSQKIADATGTISLDEYEHPVLSRIMNGKSLGDVYQLGMSMVDSAAIAGLAAVGIPGGTALLGGSAASQGVLDALEAGANDSQALTMGILNGVFEALFEEVSLEKLLKGNTKGIIKSFLQQGAVEGSEEFFTTLANTLADTLVMAEKSDYRTKIAQYMSQGLDEKQATLKALEEIAIGMGWDFMGGMLTGGIMGAAAQPIQNYAYGAELQKAGITAERLAELGKTYSADTVAYKLAGKVDANTGAYTIGRLFNEIGATLTEQNKADIASNLESKGMDPEIAQKHAEIMEYIVEGGALSDTQMKMIEKNDVLANTMREVIIDQNSTINQRISGYNEFAKQLETGNESENASRTKQTLPGQENAEKENTLPAEKTKSAESSYTVSEGGKTTRISTGEEVQIQEIESIKDRKITFRLKDGSTADASDIEYANEDEALVYEAVAGLDVNAMAANVLVGAYHTSKDVPAVYYANGIQEAFRYGLWNAPKQDLNNGPFSSMLTEHQRNTAYDIGRIMARQRAEQKQTEIKEKVTENKNHMTPAEPEVNQKESSGKTADLNFYYQRVNPANSYFASEGNGQYILYDDNTVAPGRDLMDSLNDMQGWRDMGIFALFNPVVNGVEVDTDKMPSGYFRAASVEKRPTVKKVFDSYTVVEKGTLVMEDATTRGAEKKNEGGRKTGKVHFDGDRSGLNQRQQTSLSALDTIADALGIQIYVFESDVDAEGHRIGKNGWYDPSDGSIHIDLFAGTSGQDTILFTAAHELTHFIRDNSPAKFQTLADFLMEEYGKKGISVRYLVDEQIRKAKDNGRTIAYDTAYEEVVADSMETMLTDGKVVEKLRQKDKSVWEMVKSYIHDLAEKIRKVYAGLKPESMEGKLVAGMKDSIEKIRELFTEGLLDAGEQKNTAKDGSEVRYQLREYSKHQKDNWENSKRIVLYENDEQFAQFASTDCPFWMSGAGSSVEAVRFLR